MKKAHYIFATIVAAALSVSCGGDNETSNGTFQTDIEGVQLTLPAEQPGEVVIHITSDMNWNINYPSAWLEFEPSTGSGNAEVVCRFGRNTGNESLTSAVVFSASAPGKNPVTISRFFVLPANGSGPGPDPDPDPDPDPEPVEVDYTWLDLPAVATNSNTQFVAHFASVNGKKYRNFSMLYDKKEHIAYWIAYPMHTFYTKKNVDRGDNWQYDPIVKQADQVNLRSSYGSLNGITYTRGHQVASSDRLVSAAMNDQTFFYTNMTPQMAGFNGDAWAKLETWTQGKMVSDTLYVVTGAILKTVGGNETVKYINNTAIPNYYYKVMMKRKGAGFTAVGFWYEHKANTDAVSSRYAKSIDQMEALTGFDFFVNVPADKQAAMESAYTASDWGL